MTAMLEGKEPEVGEPGHVLAGPVDPEDAACLPQFARRELALVHFHTLPLPLPDPCCQAVLRTSGTAWPAY